MKEINKNWKFFAVVAALIFFVSCDREKTSVKDDDIIGVWTIASVDYNITVDGVDIIEYVMELFGISQSQAEAFKEMYTYDMTGTFEFKADGTYFVDYEDGEDSGTWSLISGGEAILFDDGTIYEINANVVSYKSDRLELNYTEKEYEDMNEDGTDEEILSKITMVMTK